MHTSAWFLTALVMSVPPENSGPTLEKGLEVRWTGTFSEATLRPGVRATRLYDVETRLFVYDVGEHGADAALFTRVYVKPDRPRPEPSPGVVRLELVQIGPKGQVRILPSPADSEHPDPRLQPWPAVPLQALPTHEAGMFLEFPKDPIRPGLTWTQKDGERPDIVWKVVGIETYRGYPAWKITAEQKTTGYYSDRIRQEEWRKAETLTVVPARGYAARLERVIERREPDQEHFAFRSVLTLEQQGRMVYSGRLFEERRDEAWHAAAFTAMLDRALQHAHRDGTAPFTTLLRRIAAYLADHGAGDSVPYREAILAVRKRAEAAARGDLPPSPPKTESAKAFDPIAVGAPIPDITVAGITVSDTFRLSSCKGRAVLLAYFQPTAPSAAEVLELASTLRRRNVGTVVALAIGSADEARKKAADSRIDVPIFDATEAYRAHGLEATPVLIVVDADGVVRHVARGWGNETAGGVTRAWERWSR